MEYDEVPHCDLDGIIDCACGSLHVIRDLRFVSFANFTEPGGKQAKTGHFYCPLNPEKPIAYQRREGFIVLSYPDSPAKIVGHVQSS